MATVVIMNLKSKKTFDSQGQGFVSIIELPLGSLAYLRYYAIMGFLSWRKLVSGLPSLSFPCPPGLSVE